MQCPAQKPYTKSHYLRANYEGKNITERQGEYYNIGLQQKSC